MFTVCAAVQRTEIQRNAVQRGTKKHPEVGEREDGWSETVAT